jgi:hypothetical protein
MNRNCALLYFFLFLFFDVAANAQVRKFDTTVKLNETGFHVVCSNKSADNNTVSISPVGFRIDQNNPAFQVQGRVQKAMTDDFNDDGYPDLVLCIYSGANGEIGTVAAISSAANKSFVPIYFPDIFLDAKNREGYKGYDEFSTLTGTLLRKFPIYLSGDAPDKPTGGKRTIQYKAIKDNDHLTFKVLRSFDVKTE